MKNYIFLLLKHDEWTLLIMGYHVAIILEWHKLVEVTLYFCLCSINRQHDLQNVPLNYIFTTIFLPCFVSSFGMTSLSCCHHNIAALLSFIASLSFSHIPTLLFCMTQMNWIFQFTSQINFSFTNKSITEYNGITMYFWALYNQSINQSSFLNTVYVSCCSLKNHINTW